MKKYILCEKKSQIFAYGAKRPINLHYSEISKFWKITTPIWLKFFENKTHTLVYDPSPTWWLKMSKNKTLVLY